MSNLRSRYKAVIFDIDDTLLMTREPKWQQHIYVAKHYYDTDVSESDLLRHCKFESHLTCHGMIGLSSLVFATLIR